MSVLFGSRYGKACRLGVTFFWVSAQVSVDVPDQKGRFDILKVHAKNKKLSPEVELLEVALRTPGFSGADLANLLNEARFSRA